MSKTKDYVKDTIIWRLTTAKHRPSNKDDILILLTSGIILMGLGISQYSQ